MKRNAYRRSATTALWLSCVLVTTIAACGRGNDQPVANGAGGPSEASGLLGSPASGIMSNPASGVMGAAGAKQ